MSKLGQQGDDEVYTQAVLTPKQVHLGAQQREGSASQQDTIPQQAV